MTRSHFSTLNKLDKALKQTAEEIKSIGRWFVVLNFLGLIIASSVTTIQCLEHQSRSTLEFVGDIGAVVAWNLDFVILVYAVFNLNREVKKSKMAIPNQKLVTAHQINLFIWFFSYAGRKYFYFREASKTSELDNTPIDSPNYDEIYLQSLHD